MIFTFAGQPVLNGFDTTGTRVVSNFSTYGAYSYTFTNRDNALSNWQYRKKITVDYTKVSGDLTHFPVYLKITDDSSIGSHALSNGYDIRFVAADETTILDYERVTFSISGGLCNAVFWIRIPALSSTVNTDFYIYYGNSNAYDGQYHIGVWSEGGSNYYKGVWHLNQTPTGIAGEILDSSASSNNATAVGSPTSVNGITGNALSFGGTSDWLSAGLMPNLNAEFSNLTISAWIKTTSTAIQALMGTLNISTGAGFLRCDINQGISGLNDVGYVNFYLRSNSNVNLTGTSAEVTGLTDGNFHHLIYLYDKPNATVTIIVDGITYSSSYYISNNGTSFYQWTRPLLIGADNETSVLNPFNGVIDEVRISNNILRSPEWCITEFNNQGSPSTFFLLFGSEETLGGGTEYLSKAYTLPSDILLNKPISALSDIAVLRVLSALSDVLVSKSYSSLADIALNTEYAAPADIRIEKGCTSLNDIFVSRVYESYSDIISALLQKAFSSSSDIHILKNISSNNDVFVYKITASNNDIFTHGTFTTISDIQTSKIYSSNNDILLSEEFTSANDIIELLSKLFSSSNDIRITNSFPTSSDIHVYKIFQSSSDIILFIPTSDFDYPLTIIISQVSRTTSISQKLRTVIINQ